MDLGTDFFQRVFYAAECGDHEEVRSILEKSCNEENRQRVVDQVLLLAALMGSTKMVKCLIDNGADPNYCDEDGQTPLHIAVDHEDTRTMNVLLEHNANVNAVDKDGQTPIYLAVAGSWPFTAGDATRITKILLEHNANVTAVDKKALEKQRDDKLAERNFADAAEKLLKRRQPNRIERETFMGFTLQRSQGNCRSKIKDLQFGSAERAAPSLITGQSRGLGPQRCFGKSTMTVDYHSSLGEAFKSIALIVWGRPLGTGFVVGGNHIMTNCHVVPDHTSVFEVPCAAVFNYNSSPTSSDVMCCMIEPFPVITNPNLDYAILKLKPSQPLHEKLAKYKKADTIPPPLTKFTEIRDHDKVTFAGHPGAKEKAIDIQCDVYHRHKDSGFGNGHDERKHWSQTNFGRDIFPHLDDRNWVLYHSSPSFSNGSSGSPGFVPDINQEACVAVLHAFAHPDVPQGSTVTVPREYYIEQGVKIEAICKDIKAKNPALCRDIFGV